MTTKRPTKVPVECSACHATRYARPPIPDPYTCQRCRAAAADAEPLRPRDPWTVNDPGDRAVTRARWLLRRKGFLR